jgi:hypothetical protein
LTTQPRQVVTFNANLSSFFLITAAFNVRSM